MVYVYRTEYPRSYPTQDSSNDINRASLQNDMKKLWLVWLQSKQRAIRIKKFNACQVAVWMILQIFEEVRHFVSH